MGAAAFARAIAGRLFDDYDLYWIVARDLDGGAEAEPSLPEGVRLIAVDAAVRARMEQSPTPKMRSAARYAAAGADGFALERDGRLLSVVHVGDATMGWSEAIWAMAPGETGVIDIVTEEAQRGHGHAVRLLAAIEPRCAAAGRRRLLAHIWWTHSASLSSFRKAGWRRIGFSLRIRRGGKLFVRHLHLRR